MFTLISECTAVSKTAKLFARLKSKKLQLPFTMRKAVNVGGSHFIPNSFSYSFSDKNEAEFLKILQSVHLFGHFRCILREKTN